ncbi:MAG: VOC family protein, partial [Blastocatellia bacterium]
PAGVPHRWLLYFKVSSCDQAAARVKELGGNIHMPAMTIEKVGRWAVVADPQGAVFAIFEALPHS